MSLLKAFKNESSVRTLDYIKRDFQTAFEQIIEAGHEDQALSVSTLVQFYAEYGVSYMTMISTSLEEPHGASETMKFMNSFIAELVNASGLHYFNLERGFSIVDKAVQKALDNGGVVSHTDVMAIIEEIEASYIEPDVEEETSEEE
jgi:hypothetical protein